MVGMLQIITYLLCIYLIFKGFEILQIALMSNREDRSAGMLIGTLLLVIAIGAAAVFVSDGKVYKIDNDDQGKVLEHVGHKVTIAGKVDGDTIKVDSVKM